MNRLKWKGLDEDPRKITESVTVKPNILPESKTALTEGDKSGINYLLPRIEAIHAGTTRNHVRYLAEKLRGSSELMSGCYSWLHPYAKPVIYNHDTNTRATGRIHNASFHEMTVAGRPGIVVVPKITDEQAIRDIIAELLMTVSIGATTDSAVCSVCGTDILEEGFCGHFKGEVYDGIKAEWIAGNIWFDELSWVNVPADQDAQIVDPGSIIVAEAFAHQKTGSFIDLGRKSTEWVLSQQTVLAEGLHIPNKEKGDSALTIEELQAKVAELEEAKTNLETQLNEANSAIEAKDTELTEKTAELETKTNELAEKTQELETKTTELEEKTQEVTSLTEAKDALEAEKATLNEELESVKSEKTSLSEQNAELVTKMHTSLVERVVDLRVTLGKEADREKAMETYSGRSTESLNDSLSDLLTEFNSVSATHRNPGAVNNPGLSNLDEGGKDDDKKITAEEALIGLFSGPAFRKK